MKASIVLIGLLLVAVPVWAQHGWQVQVDSNGFDKPSRSLVVQSTDQTATITLTCIETPMKRGEISWTEYRPWIGLTVHPQLGFFDFSSDYRVLLRTRFLPDSAIDWTTWNSLAGSGHGNVIVADGVRDHPDYLARTMHKEKADAMATGLLTSVRRTDTLQMELNLYGRSSLVVRFPIQNHDVLEQFLAKCTTTPEE